MGLLDFVFGFSNSSGGGTNPVMSKDLMKFQSKQWRENTQWYNAEGYKMLRQGLIDAGYNPILALGTSPLNGAMPNVTATDPTNSTSFNYDGASASQASTARKISDSQIMVNKASASKIVEEALTQSNVRNNLDSQSLLNLLSSERIQRLLPYEEQKMLAEIAVADSVYNSNLVNTAYVPFNAQTGRISANAAAKNADTNSTWTPAKVAAGGLAGLLTAVGFGKFGIAKPFLKKGKDIFKLGLSGYKSSKAKYFTTLH